KEIETILAHADLDRNPWSLFCNICRSSESDRFTSLPELHRGDLSRRSDLLFARLPKPVSGLFPPESKQRQKGREENEKKSFMFVKEAGYRVPNAGTYEGCIVAML